MTTDPLISVIIPAHNDAHQIATAIESIQKQTWKNLEIIIVDDHSTDTTRAIVEAIAREDPRIQYHALSHDDPRRINWRGVNINAGYMARNFGFEKVRGKWITFQDSDDASLLNRIEIQYRLAIEHDAMHVSVDWQRFDEALLGRQLDAGQILKDHAGTVAIKPEEITAIARKAKGILMHRWFPHQYVPFIFKWFPPTRKLFFNTLDSYPCAGNTPLFKREVLEKVRFRQLDQRVWPSTRGRGADRDFCFQVAETFGCSYAFRIPLYLWRVNSQNQDYADYSRYLI